MSKIWRWNTGAPVADEHNELEQEMGPDPERESDMYELQERPGKVKQPARQAPRRANDDGA